MSARGKNKSSADIIDFAVRRPLRSSGTTNTFVSSTGNPVKPSQVSFDRRELSAILRIYGFKVADGDWRDYAIDRLPDRAIFSVFRHAGDTPLYSIVKVPKLARLQGAYSVINAKGVTLKRGHKLAQVLRVFEIQLKLADC